MPRRKIPVKKAIHPEPMAVETSLRSMLEHFEAKGKPRAETFRSLCVEAIRRGLSPQEADALVRKLMNY